MVLLGRVIFCSPFFVKGVRKNHPMQHVENMIRAGSIPSRICSFVEV